MPFGLPGRAARVEDEEGILGVEGFGVVLGGGLGDGVVPPDVAAVLHGDLLLGAAEHDDALDLVAAFAGEGLVDVVLEGDDAAAAPAAVGGDHGRSRRCRGGGRECSRH